MDILSYLSNMIVPRWVKIAITFLLIGFVGLFITLGYLGIVGASESSGWIEAAAYVLGIVLPILMIALVVLYSQTGVAALRSRINHYLATVIPDSAQILASSDRNFVRVTNIMNRAKRRQQSAGPVIVMAQPERGLCTMNYALYVPAEITIDGVTTNGFRRAMVRVELNVWKVNVNVCIEETIADSLNAQLGPRNASPLSDSGRWEELFPHSLAGAKAEGYAVNQLTIKRHLADRAYVALVLSRELKPNFMFDISQKLYFAQDLMFMVRSLMHERPDAFEASRKTP
jgi:hypothetical protein